MTTAIESTSLWTNRRYLLWLTSDTSKGLATALAGFAIPLIALIVTDEPAQAGTIAGVGLVTRLLVTLYGGVLADRHSRIALMIYGALVATVLAGGFTLLALADALTFTVILVVEVLLMMRAGLFEPASESALKEIVPADSMGRAQAANQGRDAALQLAGGPLGGVLLGIGAWLIGAVMTLCYALAAVTAWVLRRSAAAPAATENPHDPTREPRVAAGHAAGTADGPGSPADVDGEDGLAAPAQTPVRKPNAWAEIREGFTWLFSRPDLGGVIVIITIINLGFNAAITTVVYGLQQAGHSELLIGTMSAALGAVMLVGAIVAPFLVPRISAGMLTIIGLCGTTTGAIIVSMLESPWAMAAVLGASVFLLPALNASMMGYFMVATPTELLGRANSAAGVLGMGAMPLAPLIAGFGLTLVGRQTTILFSAALCAVAVVLAVTNKALRALPAEAGWAEHARRFEIR
ncbi:MFS transporter [Microbacterium sp. NPDC055903]